MSKKKKIAIIISLLIVVFIVAMFGIYLRVQKNAAKNALILEDLDHLFDSIENTHPVFF